VAIIDETLHKRGKMKLIINQPLHPVERKPHVNRPLPQPTIHATLPNEAVTTLRTAPNIPQPRPLIGGVPVARPGGNSALRLSIVNGKQAIAKLPQPRPSIPSSSNALVVGSSGRPSSPTQVDQPPRKKLKEAPATASQCVICGKFPVHPLKQCPAVIEGPQR
jgi:chromodomain-helicase-DNA-binding protein 4